MIDNFNILGWNFLLPEEFDPREMLPQETKVELSTIQIDIIQSIIDQHPITPATPLILADVIHELEAVIKKTEA